MEIESVDAITVMASEINEKQLRAAIRGTTTKTRPFAGIASRQAPRTNPLSRYLVEEINVYGRGKTRTIAVATSYGYTKQRRVLGAVLAGAEGYADAAQLIQTWLDS